MVMKEDALFESREACAVLGTSKTTLYSRLKLQGISEPRRVFDLRNARSFSLDNLLEINQTLSASLPVESVERRACLLAIGYVAADPKRTALLRHVLPTAEKYPDVYGVFQLYVQQGLIRVS